MSQLNYEIGTTHPKASVGNVKSLVVHQSNWDDRFFALIHDNNIQSIIIADRHFSDLSFLEQLQGHGIREMVIDRFGVKDLRPLEYIKDSLESLSLETPFTQAPDFSTFSKLTGIFTNWRTTAKSIFKSKTIIEFGLEKHPFETMEILADMPQLEKLFLSYGKLKSLKGIENLPNLRQFDIAFCRTLESLDGIQNAPKLTKEKTRITRCKQITEDSPYAEYVTFNDLV